MRKIFMNSKNSFKPELITHQHPRSALAEAYRRPR
ncbi:MAG: hypothetical protein XD69_1328 [Clostridia bacterium 62_21]|nr:MAG: hypothetical protein XD69_1328 [Clostridia bacterium 62_21]